MLATSTLRITPRRALSNLRTLATTAPTITTPHTRDRARKEGDISSVFASLSGAEAKPLPPRFAEIKTALIRNNEAAIQDSWSRLLTALRSEVELIASTGPAIIPEIDFENIQNHSRVQPFGDALRKRGVAVIRNVVPQEVSLGWKEEIKEYVKKNPHTKAFPADKPAVYELYWSPGQVKARAHPNVLEAQRFLMSFWHCSNPSAPISTEHPVAYADRVRIRQPGDAGFALGPHVDGGSTERWEPTGYGLGGPFNNVFSGKWEDFTPWESSSRLAVESDLYNGAGACSMFRMYQGWLSMSDTSPGEGTLLVNPLFKLATSYMLLRPFFSAKNINVESSGYLDASNWQLDAIQTPALQGATLGMTQELTTALHPHLDLTRTMVHVPRVQPGDYVAWHCDSIHAVDKTHTGKLDSSVLYIPACPLTEVNAKYLVRQREAFLDGTPGPDFPGGKGESEHAGRMGAKDVSSQGGVEGERAMGLRAWAGNEQFLKTVNKILEM
jgi:hypothetical protein